MAEPIRILWIDPDDQTFAQCTPMLRRPSWVVRRAHTFLEALELVAQSTFDFVIIEMRLADGVGTDVWHHLKQVRPDMKGIITTASPSLKDLISVSGPGILGYLLKPTEIDAIFPLIDQAVQS